MVRQHATWPGARPFGRAQVREASGGGRSRATIKGPGETRGRTSVSGRPRNAGSLKTIFCCAQESNRDRQSADPFEPPPGTSAVGTPTNPQAAAETAYAAGGNRLTALAAGGRCVVGAPRGPRLASSSDPTAGARSTAP